jgi:hypothetical protein
MNWKDTAWIGVSLTPWYILAANHWYSMGANGWYTMPANGWYIIARKMTVVLPAPGQVALVRVVLRVTAVHLASCGEGYGRVPACPTKGAADATAAAFWA